MINKLNYQSLMINKLYQKQKLESKRRGEKVLLKENENFQEIKHYYSILSLNFPFINDLIPFLFT